MKKIDKSKNLFWIYAGMDEEEYRELYLEEFNKTVADILDPGPKKNGGKKKAGKSGVQKCRVCGCTDRDCRQCVEKTGEPCYWVEEDLCSACAWEGEADNYPFEPEGGDPGPEVSGE